MKIFYHKDFHMKICNCEFFPNYGINHLLWELIQMITCSIYTFLCFDHNHICTGICYPGFYSTSGFSPCKSCPDNTYQPSYGSKSCIYCPPGTVSTNGSNSDSNCTGIYNMQKYKIASLIYVSLLYFRGMFVWVIIEYKCY